MRPLTRAPLPVDRDTGKPLAPEAFTSFAMHAPVSTHFIELPCKVAQCKRYVHGWTTVLDPGREEHLLFIQHIVSGRSGRRYTRGEATPEGYLQFHFTPGQPCFRNSHYQRDESKDELYVVRRGDFRTPYSKRDPKAMSPDLWLETFASNQAALLKAHESRME